MPTSPLVAEHPIDAERGPVALQAPAVRGAGVRATPLVAMVVGLALTGLAVVSGTHAASGGRPAATPSGDPLAITLSARDVSVVVQVYEPGQDSGWHAHAGIHAVAVSSGVLTIYDSQCRPQAVAPGRPYVGGQEPHLARNETAEPVTMTVTYLSPSAPAASTRHVDPPAGCAVGPA
jgi:quercetin dioxygenase-like cupin family protein